MPAKKPNKIKEPKQCDQQNKIFIDNFINRLVKNGYFDYLKNEYNKIVDFQKHELEKKYKEIIIIDFLYNIKMESPECWDYLTEYILNKKKLSEQHSKKKLSERRSRARSRFKRIHSYIKTKKKNKSKFRDIISKAQYEEKIKKSIEPDIKSLDDRLRKVNDRYSSGVDPSIIFKTPSSI